jgi:hypothetical protein
MLDALVLGIGVISGPDATENKNGLPGIEVTTGTTYVFVPLGNEFNMVANGSQYGLPGLHCTPVEGISSSISMLVSVEVDSIDNVLIGSRPFTSVSCSSLGSRIRTARGSRAKTGTLSKRG